jgi:sulfur dioxygenase
MIFRQLFDYESWTYTYLLADAATKEAVLIDTVKEQAERDLTLLRELGLTLKYLLETHIHADHISAAASLRAKTGAKIALNAAAGVKTADIQLKDGDEITFGSHRIRCITTPGHTNTCMSYFCEGRVFTGDVLFIRDAGRTDFQDGSPEKMFDSVTRKLFALPDSTQVFPAHDYKGLTSSTIGEEKAHNSKFGGGRTLAQFKEQMAAMKLGQPKKIHIAVPANMECGGL